MCSCSCSSVHCAVCTDARCFGNAEIILILIKAKPSTAITTWYTRIHKCIICKWNCWMDAFNEIIFQWMLLCMVAGRAVLVVENRANSVYSTKNHIMLGDNTKIYFVVAHPPRNVGRGKEKRQRAKSENGRKRARKYQLQRSFGERRLAWIYLFCS